MCFSATASFASGAVLVPLGAYCIRQAKNYCPRFLPFAIYPLAFGLQQLLEGLLWLSLGQHLDAVLPAAFGFLFFSHFFWLWWVPLSVWWLEPPGGKRSLILGLTLVGGIYGTLMYFPIIINDGWLEVILVKHSIVYNTRLIYDGLLPRQAVRLLYALVVLIPLLITSDRYVRYFGILILLSVVVAKLFFDYAFISIWCFYAAVLSIYVVYMIRKHVMQPGKAGA